MMKIQIFIDISPSKDKKVCNNCLYFFKWGVASGNCLHPKHARGITNKIDSQTCKKFEFKNKTKWNKE